VHHPAELTDPDQAIAPAVLAAAKVDAEQSGVPVRVLLLTSPHNPTGRCYSAQALLAAVGWAKAAGLHVVVDEIYACSEHGGGSTDISADVSTGNIADNTGIPGGAGGAGSENPAGAPLPDDHRSPTPTPGTSGTTRSLRQRQHNSVVALMDGALGDLVHVLYGISKDFGCAGWRVGAVYTQSMPVRTAMATMTHAHEQSTHTLSVLRELFEDQAGTATYLYQHRANLRAGYLAVTHALRTEQIPFLPCDAGVFVLLDLRQWLFVGPVAALEVDAAVGVGAGGDGNKEGPTGGSGGAADRTASEGRAAGVRAESALWHRIVGGGNINLTPGNAMHVLEPGWFRLCFAAAPTDRAVVGVQRLAKVLKGLSSPVHSSI
jgi:aspartate/methionine/tyrosine aminotransferase